LLKQWSPPDGIEVESLSSRELVAQASDPSVSPAAIILSCCDEIAGRLSLTPSEAGDHLGGQQVLSTLSDLQKLTIKSPIILLSQNGLPLELCCSAVKLGVKHFVDTDTPGWEKRLTSLLEVPSIAVDTRPKATDPQVLLDSVGIRAVSPAMQDLIVQVYRGAQVSDATCLIHGESGTGKQLLAEAIHRLDPKRGKNAFIPVNCAAITGTLAESELFGHIKGAFSGATENRAGYFRTANKGTIFLDEISELPMSLQPKLLRVLQERRVMPVGSDKEEPIDVRVIAATNISLQEKVAKGEFRLDLYQRLNVIHLAVPPLRNRIEDIPVLVQHFIEKYQHYCTQTIREVDPRVYQLLKTKAGNGNVRELENIIRQTLVFKASGTRIELQDLPRHLLESDEVPVQSAEFLPSDVADNLVELIRSKRLTLKQVVETFEKTLIKQAAKNSPEMTKVELARVLGLPRRTLYYKLDEE
jgi:transcriptional regulator with PAS, ATPase and Fis domain